jgi:hypothetical protein
VLTRRHDDEILRAVIQLALLARLDVMHVFIGAQGASQLLLHDEAMLADVFFIPDKHHRVPAANSATTPPGGAACA